MEACLATWEGPWDRDCARATSCGVPHQVVVRDVLGQALGLHRSLVKLLLWHLIASDVSHGGCRDTVRETGTRLACRVMSQTPNMPAPAGS